MIIYRAHSCPAKSSGKATSVDTNITKFCTKRYGKRVSYRHTFARLFYEFHITLDFFLIN